METELFKLTVQMGMGGIFFYLYWVTNKRMQDQDAKHDADIARLYGQRINDLKFLAKLPTDLEGDYKMGPDSRVKA
jgi:hypothetical protein